MDGNAMLTPEVYATIIATRAFAISMAAEIERERPGFVDGATELALLATARAMREQDFGEKIADQIRHLQRQALEGARP